MTSAAPSRLCLSAVTELVVSADRGGNAYSITLDADGPKRVTVCIGGPREFARPWFDAVRSLLAGAGIEGGEFESDEPEPAAAAPDPAPAPAVHPAYDRLQQVIDAIDEDFDTRSEIREAIRGFAQAAAELGILRGARLERERLNFSGTGEAQEIAKQLLGEAT